MYKQIFDLKKFENCMSYITILILDSVKYDIITSNMYPIVLRIPIQK